MASVKALAAIALTLIIAVPIGLGYGFASTEETVTSWQTDSTTNVTNLLLNHSTEYTAEYMNPYNNKELLTYDGSTYSIASPNYSSVTTTYTSLPEYTTSTGTITLSSATDTIYSIESSETVGTTGATYTVAEYPLVKIDYIPPSGVTGADCYLENADSSESLYLTRTIVGYVLMDGSSSWTALREPSYGSSTYTGWEDWIVDPYSGSHVEIYGRAYDEIAPDVNSDITFTTSDKCSLKIVTSSGTTYLAITEATSVLKTASGTVTVGGTDVYENVTGLYIAEQPSVSSITYTYSGALTGSYANPAAGWAITGATYQWWLNGQQNESVRFMVYLPSGTSCTLGPTTSAASAFLVGLSYDGSTLTVTDYTASTTTDLGNYTYAMVVLTDTEATVYGLAGWPTLGVWPNTYNYTTVDYADLGDTFPYVYMSGDAYFRVDLAEIVAGTYPITNNHYLDLAEVYPEKSVDFTIKSVALYGDRLDINGVQFAVEDGKATGLDVDGESFTFTVRGATIRYIYEDGTYTATVDGHEIANSGATMTFVGEWSVTASASLLSQTTSTQQVWAPGEFAFEKEDFAACGMLVAGVCLVGLGMTGPRSGTKIGVLLMICGGAGLIYLTLI